MMIKNIIGENYILGRIVSTILDNEKVTGRVLSIDISEFGDTFLLIEPLDRSEIFRSNLIGCKFISAPQESISDIQSALKAASAHRASIVNSISYANQISGENTYIYEEALKECDSICEIISLKLARALPDG